MNQARKRTTMQKVLSMILVLVMLLSLMSGVLVIVCSILAQIINEQIDPRFRAEQAIETSEVTGL